MNLTFPDLPNYKFRWRSVYVEPVPASGERVCIAIVLQSEEGVTRSRRVVGLSKINSVFGVQLSHRINDALSSCLNSIDNYYGSNNISSNWRPSLEGFYLSNIKESLANDINEALIFASVKSSSIYLGADIEKLDLKLPIVSARKWRSGITERVMKTREELTGCFQREVSLAGHSMPFKMGFLSDTYAAHFDSITASNIKRNEALVKVQSKLWQLDMLRDSNEMLFSPNQYELVMYRPKLEGDANQWLEEFFDEIKFESSRREIGLYESSSISDAANHVLLNAA